MPADEHLSGIQFEYLPPTMALRTHVLNAKTEAGEYIGVLHWGRKQIENLRVEAGHQRQGVAKALWHEGHRLAAENARIPKPKHSADRTDAGDAWARSVGGRLPRRL